MSTDPGPGPPPFERLLREHGPTVLRFCLAQAGADRGEDLFQETVLAALRRYGDLRDPASARAWLLAIATRKAVDAHRDRARTAAPVGAPAALAEAAGAMAADRPPPRDEALWAQVRALPAKQRAAVGLRYLGDLSHAEIASAMGTSAEAARRNVFEGLRRLRAQLDPPAPSERSRR